MERDAKHPPRDGTPSFEEAEKRFLELVRSADLPEPDEVRAECDPDELIFMWHETKTAIIVELDPPGEELLAAEAAARLH